jgi:hypothetical protein
MKIRPTFIVAIGILLYISATIQSIIIPWMCFGIPVSALQNNEGAKNPSWDMLIQFLESDQTEIIPYTEDFTCSDYALMLHNNAELMGIRAGYVALDGRDLCHALNVFEVVDRGITYVDCTRADMIVRLEAGKPYHGEGLTGKWSVEFGLVEKVTILW